LPWKTELQTSVVTCTWYTYELTVYQCRRQRNKYCDEINTQSTRNMDHKQNGHERRVKQCPFTTLSWLNVGHSSQNNNIRWHKTATAQTQHHQITAYETITCYHKSQLVTGTTTGYSYTPHTADNKTIKICYNIHCSYTPAKVA